MTTPLFVWCIFFLIVAILLVFDLGVLNRKEREISVRQSIWLSVMYIAVAISFGVGVTEFIGEQQGSDFFTGYLIEKSLSTDNIFVISMVFTYFSIPRQHQHRVLFWGILGVVLLRGLMIGLGAYLIEHFHSILYLFGIFLIYTGFKMLFISEDNEKGLSDNKLLKWLTSRIPMTETLHGNKFFVKEKNAEGKKIRKATPLFLTLIFIELADVMFAVDSVPAVFAVTDDPFIVFTSNIFAILGLRALYFALSAMIHRFHYLKYALAIILIFIGGKLFLSSWIHISSTVSLVVTIGLLAIGVITSLYKTRDNK